jgi:hypothetical protein
MKDQKSGTTWLDLLPNELDLIEENDLIDPGSPVEKGEEVIGVMTFRQKQLYTLLEKFSKELDELVVEAKYAPFEKQKEYIIRINELSEKKKILYEIFYVSIKDHFDIWRKMPNWEEEGIEGIGVRQGFKVVTIKEQKGGLSDFLKFLLED